MLLFKGKGWGCIISIINPYCTASHSRSVLQFFAFIDIITIFLEGEGCEGFV